MDTWQWGRSCHPTPAREQAGDEGAAGVNRELKASGKVVRMRQVQGKVGISLWSTGMAGEQHPRSTAQAGTDNPRLSLNGLLGRRAACWWGSQVRLPRPFNAPRAVGGQA